MYMVKMYGARLHRLAAWTFSPLIPRKQAFQGCMAAQTGCRGFARNAVEKVTSGSHGRLQ